MTPDSEYLDLYKLFCDLMEHYPADQEKRVVYYQPELFIEMAKEILKLRKRIEYLQRLELEYQIKADEVIKLCDVINQAKAELKLRRIKLNTNMDIRTRR